MIEQWLNSTILFLYLPVLLTSQEEIQFENYLYKQIEL